MHQKIKFRAWNNLLGFHNSIATLGRVILFRPNSVELCNPPKHGNLQAAVDVGGTKSAQSAEKFFAPPPKKEFFGGRCSKILCANLLKEPVH